MTNKLKHFIGNWKMFGDSKSFKIINKINKFSFKTRRQHKKKIILCIPNTLIYPFREKLRSKFISLGAQNSDYHKGFGPFTGSISSAMLKNAGAEYVILGHSENRLEGETNDLIKRKIQSALQESLNVIFCIGENSIEKKRKKTFEILRKQIKNSLIKKLNVSKIIIAYEPVWAIGTNKIPSSHVLKKNIIFIKNVLKNIFKKNKLPKILYGGSINHQNVKLFSNISEIDGFLIGGASQSSKKFIDIIKNYYK